MSDTDGKVLFDAIVERFSMAHENVSPGKMMSSPGLKYRNKVFAFYYEEAMTFKLGKGFEIEGLGINEFSYLSPFKNKPPMKAWFRIEISNSDRWDELTGLALGHIKKEMGE